MGVASAPENLYSFDGYKGLGVRIQILKVALKLTPIPFLPILFEHPLI
jgi:hypothetical protein